MRHLTLQQLRATIDTGAVLSVSIIGQGAMFYVQIKTRGGPTMLTKTKGSDLRPFRDATKAVLLLWELGVREVHVDARNWNPHQGDLVNLSP